MATTYTPHSWASGEYITKALLNHLEQGVKDAQDTANAAQSTQELRAALDMLASQTMALLRALDKRVTALEQA